MTVTPNSPEPEAIGYDDNQAPAILREEDPYIEAKLDEIFAAPPPEVLLETDDF